MADKELKNPCPLSEGEWVQYLQTYVTTNATILLTFLAIILSFFAITISLSAFFIIKTWLQLVIYVMCIVVLGSVFGLLICVYKRRSKLTHAFTKEIQELIEKIIDGDIKSDKIRDEWRDINKRYKRLKKRKSGKERN